MSDDFELAGELVRAAGELAARMRMVGLEVSHKTSISDLVSDADKAAEVLIVQGLTQARPADGVIGEEGAAVPGDRVWYIDPVDGTYNFVAGLPAWCSTLALVDDGEVILGAVYQPVTNELWLGGAGHATTLNGVPVPQIVDRPLAEISLTTYLHPPRMRNAAISEPLLAAMAGAAAVRMGGSGSVDSASVAGGRLGAYLMVNAPDWDWFPGHALVRAAGGVAEVVHHRDQRFHLAGPPTAVADLRALVLGS